MIFELVTGDLLFEPRSGDDYTKDEDHLAQIIELIGVFPAGRFENLPNADSYLDPERSGWGLRHIKTLQPWPLDAVLREKYDISPKDAADLSTFLLPLMHWDPDKRLSAAGALAMNFCDIEVL